MSTESTLAASNTGSKSLTLSSVEGTSHGVEPEPHTEQKQRAEKAGAQDEAQLQPARLRRSQRSKRPPENGRGHGKEESGQGRVSKRPRQRKATDTSDSMTEWTVEKILDAGIDSDTLVHSYLVKWKGYGLEECTWEPKRNLTGCPDAIRKFDESRPAYTKLG